MSKKDISLGSFWSQVAIVVGILVFFLGLYWDLGNRVSRLEGAFSVAEPLLLKPTVTQIVVVKTVTLTTGTYTVTQAWTPPIALLPSEWSGLVGIIAVLVGLIGLYFVRRGEVAVVAK